MANLNAYIKVKLMYMYDVFYDINKDGKISWEDFEDYIKRITATNGWTDGDAKQTHAKDTLTAIWDGLRAQADDNMDLEVSSDEWLKMWESCIASFRASGDIPKWLSMYEHFMFTVADTSGDGVIDLDEFHVAYEGYGLTQANTTDSFNRVTANGKTELNGQAYSQLWNQFFSSEDVSSPGNFLFGHYDLSMVPAS